MLKPSDSATDPFPTLLTVEDVSRRLRLSPSCIYALCAKGLIAHHRCGVHGRGTIRIEESALREYLDRSKVILPAQPQGSKERFSQLDSSRLAEAWKKQGVV